MSSNELFLDQVYIIDGVERTGAEIQESILVFELLKLQKNTQ